jgi:DUF1365 family protein
MEPLENRFVYSLFLFYIDVDELDLLHDRLKLFSRNRFNLFAFYDNDHLKDSSEKIRTKIEAYLWQQGVRFCSGKILLLTHVRSLGYVFNPVSFYFCFRDDGTPECVVAEVGNTHGEKKLFFMGREQLERRLFQKQARKNFYVSPFIDLDVLFQFRLRIPDDRLDLRIHDWKEGKRFFYSSLTGVRRELTDRALAWYSIRFPLITIKVIAAIHWQAFRLYLKRLPFREKNSELHLQQEVYRGTSHL